MNIKIEKCPCGHPKCSDYHLVGIGHFCQGSGFTLSEAQEIVAALTEYRRATTEAP